MTSNAPSNNGFLALKTSGVFDPNYDANIPGSQQLTFFPQLPAGGALTNSTVSGLIRSGQVGSLAQTYQGAGFFPDDTFSYFPNPFLLYSSMLTNISNSSYNSAQFEVIRRTAGGMQFQANYVFSKALTDANEFVASMRNSTTPARASNARGRRTT